MSQTVLFKFRWALNDVVYDTELTFKDDPYAGPFVIERVFLVSMSHDGEDVTPGTDLACEEVERFIEELISDDDELIQKVREEFDAILSERYSLC